MVGANRTEPDTGRLDEAAALAEEPGCEDVLDASVPAVGHLRQGGKVSLGRLDQFRLVGVGPGVADDRPNGLVQVGRHGMPTSL